MQEATLPQEEVQSIEDVVRGYFDSSATADDAWMERIVHTDLAKRNVATMPDGVQRLEHMSSLRLIQISRKNTARQVPANARRDIRVVEIYGNIACAIGITDRFVDFVHLAKLNGTWQIVNVIWEEQRNPGTDKARK